ncbi:MAG: choice-of-anchor D domain-containing protein [Pirellulaceae bacterium]|nr:choice-of-anchor D domain-containing protein [Pirellulaceae bacterium]
MKPASLTTGPAPGQRVLRVLHRFRTLLCLFSFAAITASALQAGTVVRFDLSYSVNVDNQLIDYFDVELFDADAPVTVANFLKYVNNGLYDDTIIHRDVQGFVTQGGGFKPIVEDGFVTELQPIPTYEPIQNEFSPTRSNLGGTIAMAKFENDPDSATSQWFVNIGDNSANLDFQNGGFTVFGQVLGEGMTLINAVNSLPKYDLSNNFGGAFSAVPLFDDGNNFVSIVKAAVLPPPPEPSTASASLSGFVYVDLNQNGIMDGDDYVVAGALVSLMRDGDAAPSATVRSAEDGSYSFGNLDPGKFSIKMETPSYAPGRDNGAGRMILDKDGNVVSVGKAGTPLTNAYADIVLGDAQAGVNLNLAQAVYPVDLVSLRMLINDDTSIPNAESFAVPGTNAADGSTLDFGKVLVGHQGSANLTVANLGGPGSSLSGELAGANGAFSSPDAIAYGPLDAGEEAGREYTYTPNVRGENTQDLFITSNAGNSKVTLSGAGVAPVQSIDAAAADAGLVRIGDAGSASFSIENIGDGNLSGLGELSNLNGAAGAGSGNFNGSGGSFSLLDNALHAFEFTYTPSDRAADSASIAVDFSNGSADGANLPESVFVELAGQGVGPDFFSDLAPGSTLDFGLVPQADLKSIFLEISNASTDPNGGDTTLTAMTILGIEITGDDAALFSVEGFTPGMILNQGDAFSLEIAYNGTGEHGDRSAVLTILTDEGAAFGLDGNGFVYQVNASLAPEPGALALLAVAGLFAAGMIRRRRA